MKLKSIKLKNFRSYQNEVSVEFGDLTAFVGKNDIGKSTILEALDIFFNEGKGVVKLDKDDINKQGLAAGDNEITISVCFEELPASIIIDSTNQTTLQSEYLLNSSDQLEIVKKYPNAGKEKVFVKANHPRNAACADLLQKKDSELRAILTSNTIECEDRSRNAIMRSSIWNHFSSDLQLAEVEIDVSKGDTKSIWDKLQTYLPLYTLFQSDRKNSDGDNEVQDPLREAVKQILNEDNLKQKFSEIATEVDTKLREVAARTLDKLREMNPSIANSLNPVIPSAESLKWADVFKSVSITGDDDIPINKRGSGVKRLILLNFFRAEAERRRNASNIPSIIYAIEEPETSQHTEHQRKLIAAFLTLSQAANTQILITTHSASLVKELEFHHLRLVSLISGSKNIEPITAGQLPYPSLNEVNFLAFAETTDEYHNELYGFIEAEGHLPTFRTGKATMPYIKERRGGTTSQENIILTEYIRHQIHHPENTRNTRFTFVQLEDSITLMRSFIEALP
ncbi:ATP-binding protein [Flavobacterium caeni]|uniref:AAA ATPase domain-containing protein n=1 Tax=Flavobacterium caeni TaxID=490189 RepID=A0A1G5KDQ3_9FLAO|nr:ATP-binding protein [Flavobacterium caeni]SCY98763.1 AAA ATPase domain-containing protein [Flavobacterium caeni]